MQEAVSTSFNSELPLSATDQSSAYGVAAGSKTSAPAPRYRRRILFVVCAAILVLAIIIPTLVLTVGSRGQEEQNSQESVAGQDVPGEDVSGEDVSGEDVPGEDVSGQDEPDSGGSQSNPSTSSPSAPPLPRFRDATPSVGLITDEGHERHKLYGGPSVVDLDRDGFPDLILCYHDDTYARVFFNQRNGTFVRAQWGAYFDNHGTVPTPISPATSNMRFSLSVGGNYGGNPRPPNMYEVEGDTQEVRDVTDDIGIARTAPTISGRIVSQRATR
ncbi:cell wall protein DAN4 [Gracilaria domingensis]|nr:cell wall protein DAN4 [Gracilaria domingensis]